jgi:hypothetical protein
MFFLWDRTYFSYVIVCTDITGSLEQKSRQIWLNYRATIKLTCGIIYMNTSDAAVMVSHCVTHVSLQVSEILKDCFVTTKICILVKNVPLYESLVLYVANIIITLWGGGVLFDMDMKADFHLSFRAESMQITSKIL